MNSKKSLAPSNVSAVGSVSASLDHIHITESAIDLGTGNDTVLYIGHEIARGDMPISSITINHDGLDQNDSSNAFPDSQKSLTTRNASAAIQHETPDDGFRPGNGGCRVMSYENSEIAQQECRALAAGMGLKHRVYNTGFSGAKLVVNYSGDPSTMDKPKLISGVAEALANLGGGVYTGCDLNTSLEDMTLLSQKVPYVLASIGSNVDPNMATGYGVYGAVRAVWEYQFKLSRKTVFFVQGCGKVGSVAASLLVAAGATVKVSDVMPGRAKEIHGAIDVSELPWDKVKCDVFVPCSVSGFCDEEAVANLGCKAICGASNIPFATPEALAKFLEKGGIFIPEAVSSAGAVLADSIEFYDPADFFDKHPYPVYSFIRHLTRTKALQLMRLSDKKQLPAVYLLEQVSEEDADLPPVGRRFTKWKKDSTRQADFVIVGAGMAGAACARSLMVEAKKAGQPCTVELVDRSEVCASDGSSAGESRMYRKMYSDPFYSKLQLKALDMWSEVERESNEKLLDNNGLVFFGSSDTGETAEGSIPGAAKTMDELGVPYKRLNQQQLSEVHPALRPQAADEGLYSLDDGSVDSGKAVSVMADTAEKMGARITEHAGLEWTKQRTDDNGQDIWEIGLSDGTFLIATKKLVLSCGSWSRELIQKHFSVDMQLHIETVTWGHCELPDNLPDMPQWFCFRKNTHTNRFPGCTGLYYGFPAVENKNANRKTKRKAKVGVDFTPFEPSYRPLTMKGFISKPTEEMKDDIRQFLKQHWPALGDYTDIQCAPYSMTSDSDFVLGDLPGVPNVCMFAGGNGRAFKFAPLLGALLADVARGKTPREDISRFSPLRDTVSPNIASQKSDEAQTYPSSETGSISSPEQMGELLSKL